MSLSDAAKEARSLLKLNKSLENDSKNRIKLYEDNRGCEKWTRTPGEPSRTKHIDVSYHHVKETVKKGMLTVKSLSTDLMLADSMTKPLPRPRHEFLVEKFCGGLSAPII